MILVDHVDLKFLKNVRLTDIHSISNSFLLVTLTNQELRTIETDPNSSAILAIYRSSKSLFDVKLKSTFEYSKVLFVFFVSIDSR